MINIDKKEIKLKKQKLEDCKVYLKSCFIGIDDIIDSFIDYIQIWYLVPELLNRPVIVNLWGMTGVGKTDLVRKTISFLGFQDRFAEIELSNIDQTHWGTNVFSVMSSFGLNDEQPAAILFDEIQRFNTINPDGTPLQQSKYIDFWELLSDGKLSKKQRDDIDNFLFNYVFNKKDKERRKALGEEVGDLNPKINYWDARSLKSMLDLDIDVNTISDMTEQDVIALILKVKSEKKIYEPINHAKTLIIISGNLDDAFTMSGQTSEADVDADIYHAFTKKITLVDVKNALTRKFRPEQVARFGNIHLIYRSLRKLDFEKLIQLEINRIIADTKDKIGIQLKITKNINTLIYRNGVFPVQGVRPVFSSIIDILDTNLSRFLFHALINNISKISVDYDFKTKEIISNLGGKKIKIPYTGKIDAIRQSNEIDIVANISVHECGHAIVYMALTGIAPLQLKSKIASSYAGGFTFPHQIHESKENLINKIKIYLAGGIAEEMIFGKQNASIGRSHDREQATILAIEYVRRFGFDDEFQAVYSLEGPFSMNKDVTDTDVEKMISHIASDTRELLSSHQNLLIQLSSILKDKGSMEANEVAAVAKKFRLNVTIKPEGYLYIFNYNNKLINSK
jgi:cell division protease FtsH